MLERKGFWANPFKMDVRSFHECPFCQVKLDKIKVEKSMGLTVRTIYRCRKCGEEFKVNNRNFIQD